MEHTFVDFLFLDLWQREERFETLENVVLKFCRHTMANDLEEAVVQAALSDVVYQFGFGIFIVSVKDLRGCQRK